MSVRVVFSLALFLATPLDADQLAVTGHLLDQEGVSAPGVRVELLALVPSDPETSTEAIEQWRPFASQATGPAGRFRLVANAKGIWKVRVRKTGFVLSEFELTPLLSSVELPDLRLVPTRELNVRAVSAETAHPISDLEIRPARISATDGWTYVFASAQTAQDGIARLEAPASREGTLMIEMPRVGLEYLIDLPTAAGEEIIVGVEPWVPWTVEVLDRAGEPADDVVVTTSDRTVLGTTNQHGQIEVSGPPGGQTVLLYVEGECRGSGRLSGGSGAVELTLAPLVPVKARVLTTELGLPLSDTLVWFQEAPAQSVQAGLGGQFEKEFSCDTLNAAREGFSNKSIEVDEVQRTGEIRLSPAPEFLVVSGTLLGPDRAPLADVDVVSGSAGRETMTLTDEDGLFVLVVSGRAESDQILFIGGEEIEIPVGVGAFGGSREIDLGEITIAGIQTLVGQVTDPFGEPVPEADIYVSRETRARTSGTSGRISENPSTRTDEAGFFEVTALGAESQVRIEVWKEGFLPTMIESHQVPHSSAPLKIVLHPGRTLEGKILDGRLNPVERAWVRTTQQAESPLQPSTSATIYTDETGRFVVHGLRPAPVKLAVAAEELEAYEREIEIPDEELLEIILGPGGKLFGRVKTAAGEPVVGAMVRVSDRQVTADGSLFFLDQTEQDGSFTLAGVGLGPCRLEVEHPQFRVAHRDVLVAPGEQQVDIEMVPRRLFTFSGTVRSDTGEAVAGVLLRMVPVDGGQLFSDTSGSEGDFSIMSLPSGSYRIQIIRPSQLTVMPSSEFVQLEDKSRIDEVVRVSVGLAVSGLLVLAPDLDISDLRVFADSGPRSRLGTIDVDSRTYELKRLVPGRWSIRVLLGRDEVLMEKQIEVGEHEMGQSLQLHLEPECR